MVLTEKQREILSRGEGPVVEERKRRFVFKTKGEMYQWLDKHRGGWDDSAGELSSTGSIDDPDLRDEEGNHLNLGSYFTDDAGNFILMIKPHPIFPTRQQIFERHARERWAASRNE